MSTGALHKSTQKIEGREILNSGSRCTLHFAYAWRPTLLVEYMCRSVETRNAPKPDYYWLTLKCKPCAAMECEKVFCVDGNVCSTVTLFYCGGSPWQTYASLSHEYIQISCNVVARFEAERTCSRRAVSPAANWSMASSRKRTIMGAWRPCVESSPDRCDGVTEHD